MNNSLAPTYKKLIGEYWVLWYLKSNSYSIVEPSFKELLDYYFQADTLSSFKAQIAIKYSFLNPNIIANTLSEYLKSCNKAIPREKVIPELIAPNKRRITKQYQIKDHAIQIHYDSELVLKTIHPSLAHLSEDLNDFVQISFDIYLKDEKLYLFKDAQLISCVAKRDYHLIQGKFMMQLLCTFHNKEEEDWISTFHGSTLTDGNTSILFVGESGKGKSTLCALLAANGFNLLADDVSPMLSADKDIYFNPSAISIKEGAFSVLKPIVSSFNDLPAIQFNKTKGLIKYLPCKSPKADHYPCNAIILVNYKTDSDTTLENVSIKTLLETLIPDSWLSPRPQHAKQFLDWLETVKIYKLTYSNTESVTKKISELFYLLNKN